LKTFRAATNSQLQVEDVEKNISGIGERIGPYRAALSRIRALMSEYATNPALICNEETNANSR